MGNNNSYSVLLGLNFKRWLILVVLCLVISVMLFPNIFSPTIVYKIGDVAEVDIKASYDFLIEDEELTVKNREEAGNSVPYVYDFDSSASNLYIRLNDVMSEAREYFRLTTIEKNASGVEDLDYQDDAEAKSLLKERFFKLLEIRPDDAVFEKLINLGFSDEIRVVIGGLITPILVKGIVSDKKILIDQSQKGIILQRIQSEEETLVTNADRFLDIGDAAKYIKTQKSTLKDKVDSDQLIDLSVELATALIKPNVTFNKRETELRKELAREDAKPFYYKIKKGEMLVREGERIEHDHLVKLSAATSSIGQPDLLGRGPGMALLLGFLFVVAYMAGMMKSRYYSDGIRYLLFNAILLIGVFVFFWAYDFIAEEIARGFHFLTPMALLFAAPVACGAMLITIFQGIGIAATFSLLISVLAALIMEGRVEFFIYFFVGSLMAAYGVRGYRERGILIKTGLKVGLVNIALVFSIETMYGSMYSVDAGIALIAGFLGGILAGVISTGIVPLIEMAFGFTTDIKLLELANLDQPLLRELMVQAPGTYHHSVIVSNMVEASAEAIQANPLLAKVSAYYHDIGKMKKPLYFIENQMGGENRHEKLAPSMSSLVLISHVKDGVELAREHKLGSEIIDIIQQHQGKSLISYFYQKAKEQAVNKASKSSNIKEEDFRYPGPKPQTKEAGLVMLADMAEAASRSLAEPTPARIQGMVQKIINKVFSDGQLDECELTLKDLHEIAKSFNQTLSGIFHHRVEYPENNNKTSRRASNADTGQFGPEDFRSGKKEDLEDDDKSLKRLGL